ncbi:MAG: hypothetical protein V1860_00460, partial [bacterium]
PELKLGRKNKAKLNRRKEISMKNMFTAVVVIFLLLIVNNYGEAVKLELGFSDEFVSAYLTKSGGKIGERAVNQSMLTLGLYQWYAYGWHNYDYEIGKWTEYDFGVGKWFALGNFTFDLSYQNWILEGFHEHVLETTVKYKSASLIWSKPFTDGFYFDRNRVYFEIKKPFMVSAMTFSPTLGTAYLNNFYSEHGFAHITGGFSAEYSLAKNARIFSAVKYQEGMLRYKQSLIYGGAGIRLNF